MGEIRDLRDSSSVLEVPPVLGGFKQKPLGYPNNPKQASLSGNRPGQDDFSEGVVPGCNRKTLGTKNLQRG